MMPYPSQLAAVLQRAANLRRDVKKATVRTVEGDPDLLTITAEFYTPGRRLEREARISRILDGRTLGQVLDHWIGKPSKLTAGARLAENATLTEQRKRLMLRTPLQAIADAQRRKEAKPPASRLDWKPADADPLTPGTLSSEVPEMPDPAAGDPSKHREADDAHYYTDAEGYRRRKLTRREMIDQGMTKDQRHAQYRRQGGPAPPPPTSPPS